MNIKNNGLELVKRNQENVLIVLGIWGVGE